MKKGCLVNHFVIELFSSRGFPLIHASELAHRDNKGIIFWINCVIVLTILFFLLKIENKFVFMLCIFPSGPLHWD
jgi:hypothetical protein